MPQPLPGRPGILCAIMLLSASSGLLDAVVYMLHHQVFANAMTGNLVLLGVALTARDRIQVYEHLVPLIGFAGGIFLGKYLLRRHRAPSLHLALLLQMAVLTLAGIFAERIPFAVLVSTLAVSGAVIITVIRRIGEVAFNITFMTGNLRALFEGAVDTFLPPPPSSPATAAPPFTQFTVIGLTVTGFFLGAVTGAFAAVRFGDHSFFLSDALLLTAAVLLRNVHGAGD